jgi:hypothetical protein
LDEYVLSTKDSCIETCAPIKWAKHSYIEVCAPIIKKKWDEEIGDITVEFLDQTRVEFSNNSIVMYIVNLSSNMCIEKLQKACAMNGEHRWLNVLSIDMPTSPCKLLASVTWKAFPWWLFSSIIQVEPDTVLTASKSLVKVSRWDCGCMGTGDVGLLYQNVLTCHKEIIVEPSPLTMTVVCPTIDHELHSQHYEAVWYFCKDFFNQATPPTPFCDIWTFVNVPGRKTKAIYHPPIFGIAC